MVQGLKLGEAGFVGRQRELAAISAAADAALESRPSVVWVEGDSGSGKTYLLRKALQGLPGGFSVLRAEADELASDVPFRVVEQLGVRGAAAAFPAGLELLERWGRSQAGGPVAVAVEDLHWADPESRSALLVAARRLGQDKVLVLVTSRPQPTVGDGWERLRLDQGRCLMLPMAPLSPAEVSEMARQSGVILSAATAERLFRHTGGHPLYARTLLSELSPEQLASPEGALPAPRSLASTTVARLLELPQGARALAAALAVLNQRTSLQVAARVGGVARPSRALDSLLSTGFVNSQARDGQGFLEFTHPLYRAAIYDDLAPSRRQQLHQLAAEVVGGRAALAHKVAAADTADDALAEEVEAAAQEEARGHHFSSAAGNLLSASQLSSRSDQAEGRLLRAARLLLAGGQTARVNALRPRLEACAASPAQSLVLGMLAWDQGDAALAEGLLVEAAGLTGVEQLSGGFPAPAETAADALAQLSVLYAYQVRTREAIDAAAAALAYAPVEPGVERAAAMIEAMSQAMMRGAPAGLERLALRLPARAEDVQPADIDLLIMRGTLHYHAGELAPGVSDLRAAVRLARHGAASQLPRAHLHLAQLLFYAGEWDEALVQGHVALSLLSDERRTWVEPQAHAALSWVLASKGQWVQAEEQLTNAQTAASELGTTEGREATLMARAALARARGEPEPIIEALSLLTAQTELAQATILGTWYPLLIVALIDQGDVKAAREKLAWLRMQATERGFDFASRIMGLQAHLSAADGETSQALAGFRQAIELLGPDDPLLDRALLHHAFGRLLHTRGDRREAVDQLRHAHDLLTSVGAAPFAKRVEDDLALTGITAPVPTGRSPFDLTEREGDVVALVSKGLTNLEVAAQLYVSVNTVEYHLRNVFVKLGISSRRELRGFLVRG